MGQIAIKQRASPACVRTICGPSVTMDDRDVPAERQLVSATVHDNLIEACLAHAGCGHSGFFVVEAAAGDGKARTTFFPTQNFVRTKNG